MDAQRRDDTQPVAEAMVQRAEWPALLRSGPLIIGAALLLVATYLPWERVVEDVRNTHGQPTIVELPVYSALHLNTGIPMLDILFSGAQRSLASMTASFLWHTAPPALGIVILLAFFSFKRPLFRWPFLGLYGVWLLWNSIIAGAYAQRVSEGRLPPVIPSASGLSASGPWWERLFSINLTTFEGNAYAPGFAWGYWVFIGALIVAWVGLVLAGVALWRTGRGTSAAGTASVTAPAQIPVSRLAAVILTVSAVVWVGGLLALPLASVDCQHPTQSGGQISIAQCEAQNSVYPLQVLTLVPYAGPARIDLHGFSAAEAFDLIFVRDVMPLVLVLLAAPFALAAAWRRLGARTTTLWLGGWALLLLVGTGLTLWAVSLVLSPPPGSAFRSAYPFVIGPAAILLPLGALGVVAGLALGWWRSSRSTAAQPTALPQPAAPSLMPPTSD